MAKKVYPNVEGKLKTLVHQLVYELQEEMLDPSLRVLKNVTEDAEMKARGARDHYEKSRLIYTEKADELRLQVIELALKEGVTFAPERGVTIKFTNGYCKVTYDSKELDRLLAKNPALAEMVNPARKEVEVDPRVRLVEKVDDPTKTESPEPVVDTATAGSIDDPPF